MEPLCGPLVDRRYGREWRSVSLTAELLPDVSSAGGPFLGEKAEVVAVLGTALFLKPREERVKRSK